MLALAGVDARRRRLRPWMRRRPHRHCRGPEVRRARRRRRHRSRCASREAQRNAQAAGVEQLVTFRVAGCADDRRLGRDGRDAVPARGVEREAPADPDDAASARRAHRLAQLRDGRLGARRRRHVHQTPTGRRERCICGRSSRRRLRRRQPRDRELDDLFDQLRVGAARLSAPPSRIPRAS